MTGAPSAWVRSTGKEPDRQRIGVALGAVVPLALAGGILAFWLFGAIAVLVAGHTEHVEFAAYVVAFLVIPPATSGAAVLQSRLLLRRDGDAALGLAALDFGVLVLALVAARVLWFVDPGSIGQTVVAGVAAIALAAVRLVVLRRPASIGRAMRAAQSRPRAELVAPATLAVGLALFLPRSVFGRGGWAVLLVTVAVEVALVAPMVSHRSVFSPSFAARGRRLVDGLVICALVPTLLAVTGGQSIDAVFHEGFFLAPANSVLHGRVVLVDVFSQYGVGVIYFLAAIFAATGIGYGVMSIVVSGLTIVEFAVLYAILRLTVRPQALAVGAVAVAILACDMTQSPPTYANFPSTSALRFGLPFVVILSEVFARAGRRFSGLASRSSPWLVGISSFWSAETFFYTAAAYLAIVIVGVALRYRDGLPLAVLRRLVPAGAVVVAIQGVYALTMHLVVGAWPNWGTYLQYLRLYSTAGFGGLPVAAWSPGFVLGAAYFASAVGLWFAARSEIGQRLPMQLIAAAGFTGFGIASFTYFVGRSHPNNLHHIVVPVVALAVIWLDVVARAGTRRSDRWLRWSACFGIVAVAAVLASGWGNLRATWPDTALGVLTTKPPLASLRWLHYDLLELPKPYPLDPAVSDGEQLLGAQVPAGRAVAVLLSGEMTDEFLLSTNRVNAIPLDNPTQDGLLPATAHLATAAAEKLPPGTFVLTDSYPRPKPPADLSGTIYKLLAHHDRLSLVARTPNVALLEIR